MSLFSLRVPLTCSSWEMIHLVGHCRRDHWTLSRHWGCVLLCSVLMPETVPGTFCVVMEVWYSLVCIDSMHV